MMKNYNEEITLVKNNRGCYIIDTVKGCSLCNKDRPNGCYDSCYAYNISQRYGYDFKKPISRDFKYEKNQLYLFNFMNNEHERKIIERIKNIKMPFVRIGEIGDPSENWNHTIKICEIIKEANKEIVVITKHIKTLSQLLLNRIKKLNITINTSISALDDDYEIEQRLNQYNRLKDYCNSILRVVTCQFNIKKYEGKIRNEIQHKLLENNKCLETVFRPKNNIYLIKDNIILTEKIKFLSKEVIVSKNNKNTYFGYCDKCPDMCGIKYK